MYTIGQFSKIGRISTKTLRYYDEIGLLKPKHIDRFSQYRYYTEEQVLEIITINELKQYGFKLEDIKAIADSRDTDLLKKLLRERLDEICIEIQKSADIQKVINEKIKKLESGGSFMEINRGLKVELKDREPLTVVSRREKICMSDIGSLIGKVFEQIYKQGLQPAGPVMTLYYDKEFEAENADAEVCVPVNRKINSDNKEGIREIQGGLYACVNYVGPYTKIGEAYAKVMNWIDENGYKVVNAPFDIYLTGPQTAKSPEEYVTEVCFPIAK